MIVNVVVLSHFRQIQYTIIWGFGYLACLGSLFFERNHLSSPKLLLFEQKYSDHYHNCFLFECILNQYLYQFNGE